MSGVGARFQVCWVSEEEEAAMTAAEEAEGNVGALLSEWGRIPVLTLTFIVAQGKEEQ